MFLKVADLESVVPKWHKELSICTVLVKATGELIDCLTPMVTTPENLLLIKLAVKTPFRPKMEMLSLWSYSMKGNALVVLTKNDVTQELMVTSAMSELIRNIIEM